MKTLNPCLLEASVRSQNGFIWQNKNIEEYQKRDYSHYGAYIQTWVDNHDVETQIECN